MDASGGINFTAKELLGRVDEKVDKILDRLDSKADRGDVTALSNRVTDLELHGSSHAIEVAKEAEALDVRVAHLERENTRRSFLADQYVRDHERLEALDREFTRFSNGLTTAIKSQIDVAAKAAGQARDRTLSNKEKQFVIASVLVAAFGTVISLVVLLLQVIVFHHL